MPMTSRWCLAAALALVPALSWTLLWNHTEGLRQRLVEQGEDYSRRLKEQREAQDRFEQNNRRLRRRLDERSEALTGLDRRLRLVEQDNIGLREVLREQGERRLLLLEQQNTDLRQFLAEQDEALGLLQEDNGRLRSASPRAAIEEADRLGGENTALREEMERLRDENTALQEGADRLGGENRALQELGILQRVSTTWLSAFAVTGLLAFTVLQHYTARISFVDWVRSERDQWKTRFEELTLRMDELKQAAAERDFLKARIQKAEAELEGMKRKVKRSKNEAAEFANTTRERDELRTRLREAEAERDSLNRRVSRLKSETFAFANTVRERDQLKTRLQVAEAARDDLRRRVGRLEDEVRSLENEAAEFANRRAEPGSYAAGLALLGLRPPITPETARTAYRRVSRTIHPDVCKGPEASRLMRLATECYERIANT